MPPDILGSDLKHIGVVVELPQSEIAFRTKQPTNCICLMIVIYREACAVAVSVAWISRRTNRTPSILLNEHSLIVCNGQAVFVLHSPTSALLFIGRRLLDLPRKGVACVTTRLAFVIAAERTVFTPIELFECLRHVASAADSRYCGRGGAGQYTGVTAQPWLALHSARNVSRGTQVIVSMLLLSRIPAQVSSR